MKVGIARMLRHGAAGIAATALLIQVGSVTFAGECCRAAEVAGVRVDRTARVAGIDLVLNGAGLRQRFGVNVYVIGLYFTEATASAQAALDASGPKRIALTLMRDVSAQSLVDALYQGIRDSSDAAEFETLRGSADRLSAIMLPLKTARKGDVVALDYRPHVGSQVVVNGRVIGHPVPDPHLYRALLKIWLGDPPVDAGLKRALLSGLS